MIASNELKRIKVGEPIKEVLDKSKVRKFNNATWALFGSLFFNSLVDHNKFKAALSHYALNCTFLVSNISTQHEERIQKDKKRFQTKILQSKFVVFLLMIDQHAEIWLF